MFLTVAILRIAPTRGAVRANKDTELVLMGIYGDFDEGINGGIYEGNTDGTTGHIPLIRILWHETYLL